MISGICSRFVKSYWYSISYFDMCSRTVFSLWEPPGFKTFIDVRKDLSIGQGE